MEVLACVAAFAKAERAHDRLWKSNGVAPAITLLHLCVGNVRRGARVRELGAERAAFALAERAVHDRVFRHTEGFARLELGVVVADGRTLAVQHGWWRRWSLGGSQLGTKPAGLAAARLAVGLSQVSRAGTGQASRIVQVVEDSRLARPCG